MSDRAARMIVLCEDLQHAVFIRRLLKDLGFPSRRIRIERAQTGKGAADRFVLDTYPEEVKEYRSRASYMKIGLVTLIDADTDPVPQRYRQLNEELEAEDLDRRGDDEKICILVPKRNIETWIYALQGENVKEDQSYPKLEREGGCQPAVEQLVAFLRDGWPNDIIPSLKRGCRELNSRLPE